MAVDFPVVAGNTTYIEGDPTYTMAPPPNTADGDVLVALLATRTEDSESLFQAAAPPGWTALVDQDSLAEGTFVVLYLPVPDASALPASWTFLPGGDVSLRGFGFIIRGLGISITSPLADQNDYVHVGTSLATDPNQAPPPAAVADLVVAPDGAALVLGVSFWSGDDPDEDLSDMAGFVSLAGLAGNAGGAFSAVALKGASASVTSPFNGTLSWPSASSGFGIKATSFAPAGDEPPETRSVRVGSITPGEQVVGGDEVQVHVGASQVWS